MFSFHKPRVYRSAEGCCICRAKSSSSRFTDSKKYEEDSVKCFDLREARHGEICNACVLLVKRFKRLPPGSNRHWGHVVDARAGPGMKSMTKFKKLKDDCTQATSNGSTDRPVANQKSLIPEKFSKIFKKNKKKVVKEKNKSQHSAAAASKSSTWESQSLPLTPESLDSDCDDVQYSPTRAIESASLKIRQAINRRGSSKRKCLPPKKFRRNSQADQEVQFFDENLWVKRKSCCGIVFENKQLGAIILDIQNYIPCAEHRRKIKVEIPAKPVPVPVTNPQLGVPQQFSIKTTPYQMPFNPPANRNPTPVLKKHHLFYKRQSESFPLGDMKQMNNSNSNSNSQNHTNSTNITPKTDFVLDFKVLPNSLPTSSAVKIAKLNPIDLGLHNNSHLQITPGKMPAPYDHHHQQAALHKISSSSKSSTFMHKAKSDTGKIVKHSLEKFNTLRLKPSELSDVKHMVKTVDKPFLIKPVSALSQDKLKKMGLDSVTCSSSSSSSVQSVATKFNDNSSDSGFDENLQDRKSVSPLQDDGEKKIMTIPVQTMYLASGVQIHGQHQNLLLTGNDVAAKILQNRKQMQNNRNGVKIAQIVAGGGGAQKMRAIYSQSSEGGAIITTSSTTSPNILTIPPKSGTTTTTSSSSSSNHFTKTPTNIILNGGPVDNKSSNVISTSVPSLNQKIILVKTKYNSNNSNNQSVCKN